MNGTMKAGKERKRKLLEYCMWLAGKTEPRCMTEEETKL